MVFLVVGVQMMDDCGPKKENWTALERRVLIFSSEWNWLPSGYVKIAIENGH